MRLIALDTETTGLEIQYGHKVIEIGCVEIINRRLTGKHFHSYLNPQRLIDTEAHAVHGITDQFLVDKPLFHEILEEFMNFIQGAELIIHNAPFDIGFLDHEIIFSKKSFKKVTEYCKVIDTLVLARQLFPGQKNNLDALCKRYQIDNSHRDLHGALIDAKILAQVYLAMTGGQVNLFDESSHQVLSNTNLTKVKIEKRQGELIVLHATQDELKAHQDYLVRLKNQCGECVWDISIYSRDSN